jgi:hypothetical protein
VRTDLVALMDQKAHPSGGWATAALALLGDPSVGAVVGPTVARLGGPPRRDAAGVLTESRLGVAGARVRHHVGRLQEVGDYPAANIVVRTEALRRALAEGAHLDDRLCSALRKDQGLSVLCSPDVVVTVQPEPLFRPHLGAIWAAGLARGRQMTRSRPRPRHIAPAALVALVACGPAALAAGGAVGMAWAALVGAYLATLIGFLGVIAVLHRRPAVAGLAAVGAGASHLAFGAGVLAGLVWKGAPEATREMVEARR